MLLVVSTLVLSRLLLPQAAVVERAWKLAGSGHQREAAQILQQSVQRYPNNPDARMLLGSLLSEEGRQEEAVEQLTIAVRLLPRSAQAQIALGEVYSSSGKMTEARGAFERAVALQPTSGVAQLDLGRVLLDLKDFSTAGKHLDLAIAHLGRDTDAATAHYLRAKVYTADNDVLRAIEALQQAVTICSEFPEVWSDLGQARQASSDHSGALIALRKATALAPNDGVAQYRLGKEYLQQQQPHLAIEPLQEADRLSPGDQSTLNALQKALRQDGQQAAADEIKGRLAGLLKQRETAAQDELLAIQLNNEGARLQSAGDLQGAAEKYGAAIKLLPGSVPMRVNYAVAMLRLGKWQEGLNELHASLLMDPHNDKIKAALRDALAQAPAGTVPAWKDEAF